MSAIETIRKELANVADSGIREDAEDYALRLVETVESMECTIQAAQMVCRSPKLTAASSAGIRAALVVLDGRGE